MVATGALTSRLPVIGLPQLPKFVHPTNRLYLKPRAIPAGTGSNRADRRAHVLIRSREHVDVVEASLDEIGNWIARVGSDAHDKFAARVRRLCGSFAGKSVDCGPVGVMGVINVTPDSFSDGGRYESPQQAVSLAGEMVENGVDVLDIGGESTRPGAQPVPLQEELDRVIPAVEAIRDLDTPISIDTRKSTVMGAALDAGATIVNDVTALEYDCCSLQTVRDAGCRVILMHSGGDPRTMQNAPVYDHASLDVFDYLEKRISLCLRAGIRIENIAVDPGIGFGKTVSHNLVLLRDLALFTTLGTAVVVGASRKRFIGTLSGVDHPDRRLSGSVAVALAAAASGASMVRVHDVAETVQALRVWHSIGIQRVDHGTSLLWH